MTDWTFYSPSVNYPSAGDLLKAIPSRRNIRIERVVEDDQEVILEAVRAAELLLDLDVTLRLQNEPDAALRFRVSEANATSRRAYSQLGVDDPRPEEIAIVADLSLHESALGAGQVDLVDDVVCGLERVFPGGIAHSPITKEIVPAREIVRIMDPEQTRWSHVDAHFELDSPQFEYVSERLGALPSSLQPLVQSSEGEVAVRGRFPCQLQRENIDEIWHVLLEVGAFARRGHVRMREEGVWQNLVEGIGQHEPAPPPAEWLKARTGVRGVLRRFLNRD